MRDKRRDSGEYYPGGRVIARPGTAPQQVVVQWSDVQNKPQVAPLPERYKDSDVKTKINEIASKFATVAVAALIGWSALGGVTVHTARKDQIYNDEPIVTNVTYSAEAETDPTVPAWAKAAEPPQTMTTNAVRDIIRKTVDGAARMLPKYLWRADFDDSYPDEAAAYYRSRGNGKVEGGCSAVRSGGYLYRNFDFPFDERAEFVVKMSAGGDRFASVGVAQVGTNLTEAIVTSGKPSRWYKALPGATVDGINENGVACNINVNGGTPRWNTYVTDNPIHPLAVVRWVLDNATNAAGAASFVAKNVRFPPGWKQNFHYMIADESSTYIVENGVCIVDTNPRAVLTNFNVGPFGDQDGDGVERYDLLLGGANITNVWYTNAYRRETNPPWLSDLAEVIAYTNDIFDAWAAHPKEYFRNQLNGGQPWWQTVHSSIYDLTNRTLRVAVQENPDWYVFALAKNGTDEAKVREIAAEVVAPVASSVSNLTSSVSGLQSSKADRSDIPTTPQQVGAYPSASGQQLAGQVATIGAHLNAEDARFVSTNYNSATRMPEAYVEIKLPDQTWSVVWREMTRWNWFFDTWVPENLYTRQQVDALLSQKADRAWGFYDSHSGTYAPDGYTWISSPKVALAAGLGYQRTVTTEGSVWVLESNGLVTETGGVSSNGFFRISDDEGNVHFEIVKGNRRTIGADASSCQALAAFTPTKLQIGYSVISDAHPTLRICGDLATRQWKDETDPDCLANVTWEGSSGAWVAYVQGKAAQSALFVKATYETGAESYIKNVAPVSMDYMYLGGVKYAVGTATISGHTVLTLTPAP